MLVMVSCTGVCRKACVLGSINTTITPIMEIGDSSVDIYSKLIESCISIVTILLPSRKKQGRKNNKDSHSS
jgi:hypothetical protein